MQGKFPYNTNSTIDFPIQWVQCDFHTGHINLIPTAGTIASFIFTAGQLFMPEVFRFQSYVPRFFSLNYEAGFMDGEIPLDIQDAVAKIACISIMNVLGDLVGGVGVLGGSIGMDGLSQFISLTKTATTGAFYSRVLQYRTELWGSNAGGPGSQLHSLRRRYRPINMINL